ncbi:CLUMA_CG004361, isoform A [Clunio marinus]|uniref:CLUMA_CG004361, isoform A n=1 Tax=Clunio marinus TaxID=568069 RepID=A0A1J1HTF1_9DIPT|nr:CLUMA_CG004361, isoform A [Clunio marinus]
MFDNEYDFPDSTNSDDVVEFFKEFQIAQREVFEWLRNEYHQQRMPTRFQRDVDAINGDTWYKNYQIKECQTNNKSSLCKISHVKNEKVESNTSEISELFDDLEKTNKTTWKSGTSYDENFQSSTHHDENDDVAAERINDRNIKLEQLLSVSDHREIPGPNYSPNQFNIKARLNAKQFLAKQQNAIHEIEMKHQHLDADDAVAEKPKSLFLGLNGNQLREASSNSHFPLTFKLDTSSNDMKRSSDQNQKLQQFEHHFDDEINQKRNDLFDEIHENLDGKHSQKKQSLKSLHRVKRRDVQMDVDVINRLLSERKLSMKEFLKNYEGKDDDTINDIFAKLSNVDNMNNVNEIRDNENANATSTATTTTAKQEMNNGNEIHKLVNLNADLKRHIKPHLVEPKYTKLKDSSKISNTKIDNMMSDLVEFINDLVNDQIEMRTCITLTPELENFYSELIGRRNFNEESSDYLDDENERYSRFLTPKKRLTRKVCLFNLM